MAFQTKGILDSPIGKVGNLVYYKRLGSSIVQTIGKRPNLISNLITPITDCDNWFLNGITQVDNNLFAPASGSGRITYGIIDQTFIKSAFYFEYYRDDSNANVWFTFITSPSFQPSLNFRLTVANKSGRLEVWVDSIRRPNINLGAGLKYFRIIIEDTMFYLQGSNNGLVWLSLGSYSMLPITNFNFTATMFTDNMAIEDLKYKSFPSIPGKL